MSQKTGVRQLKKKRGKGETMPRTPRPPASVTLTALRRRRGWSEEELGDADGISGEMVSLYESGARPLAREKLDTFAGHMGFTREEVSFLLQSLESTEPAAEEPRSPVDPSPAERRRIRSVAVQVGLGGMALVEAHVVKTVRARRARKARRRAAAIVEHLLAAKPQERRLAIETEEDWAVAEALAHESEKAAPDSAWRALEIARLAVRAAELSPGDDLWKSRLQGYALIFLANALRVGGRFKEADAVFVQARRSFEAGAAADPGLLAAWRLPDREASLRRHQERFAEALDLHVQAFKLAPREARGRVLLNQAVTQEQMRAAESALATLKQAEPLIDGQREPRQLFGLRFNRIVNLCHLGRYEEADVLLPDVREIALELGLELDLVRVLWLQSRIWAGLAHLEKAILGLEQVRGAFRNHPIPYDFAEASLDLALLYRSQARCAEVKALARQMAWIFQEQGVHGEAKKALRIFCEAAEEERLTVELVRRLLDYLARARHNPRLVFEQ
jgi:tetratricopeptide (TPR) repeat protein